MAAQVLVALQDERQEYHRLQATEARAAGARSRVSVDVVFAENNAVVQIQQVFARLHAPEAERPAAVVLHSVTGEALERVARNAVKADVGWVILNRRVGYIDGLRQERPDLPIAAVTPDQVEIGHIHARQVRALAPGGGLILYLQGPADTSAAQDRLAGIQSSLGNAYEWKLLSGDWTEATAERAVAGWLRLKTSENRRPAVIVAQNDEMAVGARRAVIAHHPAWSLVPVVGCDALPDSGQRLVASGELAASVVMPATAGAAVDLVARWIHDATTPAGEVVLAPTSHPAETSLRPR